MKAKRIFAWLSKTSLFSEDIYRETRRRRCDVTHAGRLGNFERHAADGTVPNKARVDIATRASRRKRVIRDRERLLGILAYSLRPPRRGRENDLFNDTHTHKHV